MAAMAKENPRNKNGHRRKKQRAAMAAKGAPCHICGLPIDYSLGWYVDPTDGKRKRHPMSFEIDELVPVSRWQEAGYASASACASDPANQKPSHRVCNQRRSNKDLVAGHAVITNIGLDQPFDL